MSHEARTRMSGVGRVLVLIYGILAIGATGRSGFQILTKFDEAPLAYVLSAVAAVVYILATIALVVPAWRPIAWMAISFELAGVLVVGTLSLTSPHLFAHPSVWSQYGSGYLFIPLVLPVLGLVWLYTHRTRTSAAAVA